MDKVVHFEIPFDDKSRAMRFYGECFGWKLTDMPQMNYVMAESTASDENQRPKEPGAINGGLMTRGGAFTAPVITIEADDIDDTLLTVEKLGGAVAAPKAAVGDVGYTAYFTDTEGNVIGLWQSARK